MKIAFDIHGTIDSDPKFFGKLFDFLKGCGVTVYITTGVPLWVAIDELSNMGLLTKCDKIFSITDYHISIGTDIRWDERDRPWIEDELWDRSKADFCKRENIDLHIDNSPIYGKYFETPYLQFKGME